MPTPTPPPDPLPAGSLCLKGHMSDGVGTTFGPEPGATLTATPEELRLTGKRGDFRLPREAVAKLGRTSVYPWFFRGVRIRHRIAGYPETLQFLPMEGDTRQLLSRLRTLGFPAG